MKYLVAISAIIITFVVTTYPIIWGGELYSAVKATPVYKEECGECHMVYPAGLLPARSWEKIMTGLEDHFGDNAELDPETQQLIHDYLVENSTDHSSYRRTHRFSRSVPSNETPLRITDIVYFKHKHDEIPIRFVTQNDKVKSFSHCQACHRNAEQGEFIGDDVNIPGVSHWDD